MSFIKVKIECKVPNEVPDELEDIAGETEWREAMINVNTIESIYPSNCGQFTYIDCTSCGYRVNERVNSVWMKIENSKVKNILN